MVDILEGIDLDNSPLFISGGSLTFSPKEPGFVYENGNKTGTYSKHRNSNLGHFQHFFVLFFKHRASVYSRRSQCVLASAKVETVWSSKYVLISQ